MLDEWVEAKIDELCEKAPVYWKPKLVLLRNHGFFWRLYLYLQAPLRRLDDMNARVNRQKAISERQTAADELRTKLETANHLSGADRREIEAKAQALEDEAYSLRVAEERHIRREDKLSREEADRRGEEMTEALKSFAGKTGDVFGQMGLAQDRLQFGSTLFLSLLAALGTLQSGGDGCAACAAAFLLFWLSTCLETDYAPVSRGIRQRYLGAMLLRAGGFLTLLGWFFARYVRVGVTLNIVLQGAMVIALATHLIIYVAAISMNRRQQFMARVLCGVLGAIPALAASAAIAVVATSLTENVGGALLAALGMILAFLGEELSMSMTYGSIRLWFGRSWVVVMTIVAEVFLLSGVWMMG